MAKKRLAPDELREAIASSIAYYVKAYDVEAVCIGLGLAPAGEHQDPFNSKRLYARSKLIGLPVNRLRSIARQVAEEYGDDELSQLLDSTEDVTGVKGDLRNLIFASNGPKPRIVLRDAINNVIEIVENERYCLVYDRPLSTDGLKWGDLVSWWAQSGRSAGSDAKEAARQLYRRLSGSLASEVERTLFRAYCKRYASSTGLEMPALIPQVYLHYDPYTKRERLWKSGDYLGRERMDFLLLLPGRHRVVIEVDGKHHYAEGETASPRLYSEMVAEDRRLRLAGYEVYRFGGHELMGSEAESLVEDFFAALLARHDIDTVEPERH